MENEFFEGIHLYDICNSKGVKISPNQHDGLHQHPFYIGFFENYKGPGTSFQATIFTQFFDKKIYFVILRKLNKFHFQTVLTS